MSPIPLFSPSSGFNRRIVYLKKALEKWEELAGRGNPFATDRLEQLKEQLKMEEEIFASKNRVDL